METDRQFLQRRIDEQAPSGLIVLPPGVFHLDQPLRAEAERSRTDWFKIVARDTVLVPQKAGRALILPYPSGRHTMVDFAVAHPDALDQPYVHCFGSSKDAYSAEARRHDPHGVDFGTLIETSFFARPPLLSLDV